MAKDRSRLHLVACSFRRGGSGRATAHRRTSGARAFRASLRQHQDACRTSHGSQRLGGIVEGVFYAPLDLVWVVRRVLRRLRPSLVVVVETEIWPNLFREARRLGCGLAIVNGRISDRALPRYRRFAGLFSSVLSLCDRIIVQSDDDARPICGGRRAARNRARRRQSEVRH